ncbi:MAG TPA: hypothetical protein VJR89_17235 [Polyangiales bacterium]|nr:hypothetical protein [Polyangiales bacterium]
MTDGPRSLQTAVRPRGAPPGEFDDATRLAVAACCTLACACGDALVPPAAHSGATRLLSSPGPCTHDGGHDSPSGRSTAIWEFFERHPLP